MALLRQTYQLIKIVKIFAKHDALCLFSPLVSKWWLARFAIWLATKLWGKYSAQPKGIRLANALGELGPSFIKLGQALSVRADVVGDDIARDLTSLQDRLPAFDGKIAIKIIEKEMGKSLDQLFQDFNPIAVAAASIAQVHSATTHQGDKVAIKLLRPHIEERFHQDMDLLTFLAQRLEHHWPKSRRLRPIKVVERLREWIEAELDLRLEGAAASELSQNFENEPNFHVPTIYWELTSTKMLTMEWVEGFRIDDLKQIKAAGLEPSNMLKLLTRAFLLQVFRDGYFHADMHPGNLLMKADGTLCPVDFGIMGRIDRKKRIFLADTIIGFLTGDYERVSEAHFKMGYVPNHKSRGQFSQALRAIGAPILDKNFTDITIAKLLQELFQTTERFDMPVQPELLLLQKTMLIIEGVGRILDPKVNMWVMQQDLIEEWYKQNFGPKQKIHEFAIESWDTINRLPQTLNRAEALLERMVNIAEDDRYGYGSENGYDDMRERRTPQAPNIMPPLKSELYGGKISLKNAGTTWFNGKIFIIAIVILAVYWLNKHGFI